jgi:ferredoxin
MHDHPQQEQRMKMATVLLKSDNIKVTAPAGTTLRKIATKTGASMEFGCRVGDCATCVAHVESGMEYLTPRNEKEARALAMLDGILEEHPEQLRLLCQCTVASDDGEIVIAYR